MSNGEVLARLEALLHRVRTRAAQPRVPTTPVAGPVAAPAFSSAAVPSRPSPAPAPRSAPAFPPTEPSMRAVPLPPVEPPKPAPPATPPPPLPLDEEVTFAQPKPAAPRLSEPEIVVDVEVPAAAESRERLVAAEPVPPEAVAEPVAAPTEVPEARPESLPPADIEAVAEEEDEVDRAPISSRRPVAPEPEERLAEMAFGAEDLSPPIHTPPPESGRLPAAPIVEFDGDTTGVREAPPIAQAVAAPRTRELVPEVTRPAIPPGPDAADILGEAQRFSPSTFLALLDASLLL